MPRPFDGKRIRHGRNLIRWNSKHFALIIQDHLLDYLRKEFNFAHLKDVRLTKGHCQTD
jgi:hypothetical protein